MPDAATELERASADIALTRDAREILDRAAEIASARGSLNVAPADVLNAMVQIPHSLADREIAAMGFDPKAIGAQLPPDGSAASLPLRQLLVNANREAQVLGHYQVDSIHLLLVMLYSDSPTTSVPLMRAGLTLYDLRRHLQTASQSAAPAAAPAPRDQVRRDKALRRRPWPSLRGVLGVSPFFLATVGVTAVSGALLWINVVPRSVPVLTLVFVLGGWIISLCIHEFGHAFVAYLGGDRSVVGAGYLSLNPLRYQNLLMSLNLLPVPGLDGFGIIRPWLPNSVQYTAMRYSTIAIYGVFILLWFVAPVRSAFFQIVYQLASLANIDPALIIIGQLTMRFF